MSEIPIKSADEIDKIRKAGKILAEIYKELLKMPRIGVDAWEFEERFLNLCMEHNVTAGCKNYAPSGYPPFPCGLCFSINEQSVHCFPVKGVKLKEGDIVTIDTVIEYEGYYADSAISFGVGNISEKKQKLLDVTQQALDNAISVIKPGIKIGKISNRIQKTVENAGFNVLKAYAGHGIGKEMHEPPEIPCFGNKNDGPKIKSGMVLAIEPLVTTGSEVLEHRNYWETKTVDGGFFCQKEHTVLVTDNGHEVLTSRD